MNSLELIGNPNNVLSETNRVLNKNGFFILISKLLIYGQIYSVYGAVNLDYNQPVCLFNWISRKKKELT